MSAVLEKVAAPAAAVGHHQWIALSQLTPSPLNHRKIFDKVKLDELAASIRAQGVIQPIIARPLPDADKFEVVAGERRFRAAKLDAANPAGKKPPAKTGKGLKALGITPLKPGDKVKPAKRQRPVAQFMKPMKPSAELAAIVGDKPMARTEITSKLWGYIKKNDLQDKTNRRMINVDAKLGAIAGKAKAKVGKQFSMFEMTKIVAKNIS